MTSATASERARRLFLPAAVIAALALSTSEGRADVSAADKAAAEALFEHARSLMKKGSYRDACAKFQESQRIDPGIGTMLYLADCFEKNGQTASAWATFLEAAAAAHNAGQADREKKARERAAALEGKLNKLSIKVGPGGEVPGLEVSRDGAKVAKALWGTEVPLDPGEHVIDANAPGKKPWTTKVKLDPANLAPISIVIPPLSDAPPEPAKVEPPKVEPPKVEPPKAEGPRAEPPKPLPITPGPIVTTRDAVTSPGRVAGGIALGLGVAGLAAGGILGALALQNNAAAKSNCWPNDVCNSDGVSARNAALGMANGSTIGVIAGGVAAVTGLVVLLATNPASQKAVVSVRPMIGAKSGALAVGGSF